MENIVVELSGDLDLIVGKLEELNQSMVIQRLPEQPHGTRVSAKKRVQDAEVQINRLLAQLRYTTVAH